MEKHLKASSQNWKSINGYMDYYEVSDLGVVRSLDRFVTQWREGKPFTRLYKGRELKPRVGKPGYEYVHLSRQGISKKTAKIHRLVAETFLPRQPDKPQVNHINGVKTDNTVSNLEWCTVSENIKHSFRLGLSCVGHGESAHNFKGEVEVFNKDGLLVDLLLTRSDARSKGYTDCGISSVITGLQKTHRGMTFRRIEQ